MNWKRALPTAVQKLPDALASTAGQTVLMASKETQPTCVICIRSIIDVCVIIWKRNINIMVIQIRSPNRNKTAELQRNNRSLWKTHVFCIVSGLGLCRWTSLVCDIFALPASSQGPSLFLTSQAAFSPGSWISFRNGFEDICQLSETYPSSPSR